MSSYLWSKLDAIAIHPVTGDEVHYVPRHGYFRRVSETGNKVALSRDAALDEIDAIAEQRRVLEAREAADNARRAAAAAAEASAQDDLAAAIRAAHPSASDAAVAVFLRRYGSGWTVEPGYGPYDGYGDGADQRLADLLAACERGR